MIPDYVWFALVIMAVSMVALGIQCTRLRRKTASGQTLNTKTANDVKSWLLISVVVYEVAILFTLATEYVFADPDISSWIQVGFLIGFATSQTLFVMFKVDDAINSLTAPTDKDQNTLFGV